MPMNILTLLQTIGIFAAYLFVSAVLPAFVFGKRLKGHRLIERFLIYFMIGNFYIINLVYLLQLLKISYPATLMAGTLAPAVGARLKLNHTPVREMVGARLEFFRKLNEKSMGRRTARLRVRRAIGKKLAAAGRFVGGLLVHSGIDCLLTLAFLALLCWLYGTNLLQEFGYKASDLPVHNYWINAMGENHIFVAGVYPHGFHCVIYYLHAVFRFDTYNLLRIFGFVQCVMVHVMLLFVLKLCCRSKYAPYVGSFLYAGSTYLADATYSRFYSALPQEFGMIFIFPAVYFGFAYFAARPKELPEKEKAKRKKRGKQEQPPQPLDGAALAAPAEPAESAEPVVPAEAVDAVEAVETAAPAPGKRGKRKKKEKKRKGWHWQDSYLYLAGFAMSFSMTLTVHFYGTMIAGLFCVAMAAGYAYLFFRRKYFWNVVLTCVLSVFIAALPMAAAYLGGTPLQGSLGWGMNVILGSRQSNDAAQPSQQTTGAQTPAAEDSAGGTAAPALPAAGQPEGQGPAAVPEPVPAAVPEPELEPEPAPTVKERLQALARRIWELWEFFRKAIFQGLGASVLRLPDAKYINWVIYSFAALVPLGALLFLLRQRWYGAMLASSGLYMVLMGVLMKAGTFGLPALMDSNRSSIYFAYSLPIAVSLLVDGVLVLLSLPFKRKFLMHALSLACVCLAVWHTWDTGCLRQPRNTSAMEMNEAIICMENIIATEPDFTWTVVSANDELRMGTDHGYHYETITFLEEMEGGENWENIRVRIPTPVVYIFIEKVPLDYFVHYEGSGQPVSRDGADNPLPRSSGIKMYQGEQRWILMSRMYYWAQEFARLYPHELDVYLETERFVCYRIEQNMYRLYDFAIDYDFNTRDYRKGVES